MSDTPLPSDVYYDPYDVVIDDDPFDEMLKRWPEWDDDYERAHKAHTTSVRGWESLPIRTKLT